MSRRSEIRNQYQGYVAAREAVKKTDPGEVKVPYGEPGSGGRYDCFIYNPKDDDIRIALKNGGTYISAETIPALIKALREFFEEEKTT